jgi:hypothetical protein
LAIVTLKEMVRALSATLGRKGVGEEEIVQIAEYLMSFFGYHTEVIDNMLEPEDRDVFYLLEEEGLLTTRQEEVFITKGKLWRIHYWVLRADRIHKLGEIPMPKEADEHAALYMSIPDDVWARQ